MEIPSNRQPLRILGIDPGLANCGWGVIEKNGSRLSALAYGSIATEANTGLVLRLKKIAEELTAVVERYHPSELGIETVYHKGNSKSAISTAEARGAALLAAAGAGMAVGEYPPATIKSAVVGNGAAEKQQVGYMVKIVLGLEQTPTPDHAADALAAAICHAHMRLSRV
jgi:crossover junction endodeoxyribonuclease RuvC